MLKIGLIFKKNANFGGNNSRIVGLRMRSFEGMIFNPVSANPTKWSNTLKQFVGKLRQIV